MDTTPTLSATGLAAAAAAAAAAGTRTDDDAATQGDAFALLLRSLGNRFENSTNPLDANTIRTEKTRPDPKPVEARDDRRADRDDKKADAADKSKDADKTKAADRGDAKDDSANAAADDSNAAADAQTQVDAAQAAQLAAIQAQLIANTAAPVAQTVQTEAVVTQVQAVVAAPVVAAVDANADANTQIVEAAPTGPVAEVVAQVVDPKAPQAAQQAVAAIQQIAPEQAKADEAAAVVVATGPKQDVAALAQTQDVVTDEMPVLPQANQVRAAAGQQTQGAKSQSELLSRLLGTDNQIKIAVNVEAAKPATPSINPYNHFIGYSMDNAAQSLANGGLDAETQAVADDSATNESPRATLAAPTATTAAFAALVAGQSTPTTSTTASPTAAPAPAIASVGQPQGAATQGDSSQAGLGQGQTGTNSTGQTAGTNSAEAAKQAPAPSQIFDQIKVHITRATKAGLDRVTIQLRPDDLGRVEVKLEMAQDGKVHALVVADNPDTLQLMQNDARGLERALNDAGLRTDANALEFSLRGDKGPQSDTATASNNGAAGDGATGDQTDEPTYDYTRAASQRGGVDTYA